MAKKINQLKDVFYKVFCDYSTANVEHSYFGRYISTSSGLPLIGELENENIIYAINSGKNNALLSIIAKDIISNLVTGKLDENANIFKI